jgi:hypothetical protein
MSEPAPVRPIGVFLTLTGAPDATCRKVNAVLEWYTVIAWNWSIVHDELILTALMIDSAEIRKAALAQIQPTGNSRRQ